MIWHAIHRNDWRSREKIHNFARFEVAHIQFDLHERVMQQVPNARTRVSEFRDVYGGGAAL
ncbi:MAG: hypothetical protein KatS3mg087_0460 [Patescibacteria group bacterium]|nr:MAG: hypothetical protein KatS3mg087_0460 [Patescibacteria group bacterium]